MKNYFMKINYGKAKVLGFPISNGMRTKKSLGQHFLHSPKIIGDIVGAGKVKRDDVVLEIGPGEGTLTYALLQTGAYVVAVEKDDRLIPILQEKFAKEISTGQFILIHSDILDLDISKIPIYRYLHTRSVCKYKVVANIPYYITGQIIRMFLERNNQPKQMTLLVQKEVAERIVARDGKESLLSLSVKVYGKPRLVRIVGRGAFQPQPNVDSAVLSIENISKDNFSKLSEKKFFAVLHAGFAHKRKQLLSNLSSLYKKETLLKAFDICKINLKARAEDIPLKTWLHLCNILK